MPNKSIRQAAVVAFGFATALTLAGCGTTPGERAVSGGVIGAGAGAAIGSVTGSAGRGAIIGGVGGAALGALTTPAPPRYSYDDYDRYYLDSFYDRSRCAQYSSYNGRCVEWVRF